VTRPVSHELKKAALLFLLKALTVPAVCGGFIFAAYHAFAAKPTVSTSAALEILRSEPIVFLATDRITTNIVVDNVENNLLLGKREGYLIARVTMFYGVDLQKLSPDAIQVSGDVITVTLPAPQELVFAVDMHSMRFLTKRSGWIAIRDWPQNLDIQAELREQLHQTAQEALRKDGLIPSREDIVRRLNGLGRMLSKGRAVRLTFR
jgi:hypothetical protein